MSERRPVAVLNVHTLIGGVLGVASAFLPWVVRNGEQRFNVFDIFLEPLGLDFGLDYLLPLAAIIFLLGACMVFISPLGATAELGGAAFAIFTVGIVAATDSSAIPLSLGMGPFVAILAAGIVFLSVVFPFGLGYGHWIPLGNRGRNYTLSYYRDLDDSDGLPYWWWLGGPGVFWYWWFEMREGWAFRDAWEQHQKRSADRHWRSEADEQIKRL